VRERKAVVVWPGLFLTREKEEIEVAWVVVVVVVVWVDVKERSC
jgi:hypothetical protein